MANDIEPIVSKTDFIEQVREQFKDKEGNTVSRRDAELICGGVFKAITESLKFGKVKIYKFGSFSRGVKPERNGRNPRTGKAIKIPSRIFIKLKPSPNLKGGLEPFLRGEEDPTPLPKRVETKAPAKKKAAAPAKKEEKKAAPVKKEAPKAKQTAEKKPVQKAAPKAPAKKAAPAAAGKTQAKKPVAKKKG